MIGAKAMSGIIWLTTIQGRTPLRRARQRCTEGPSEPADDDPDQPADRRDPEVSSAAESTEHERAAACLPPLVGWKSATVAVPDVGHRRSRGCAAGSGPPSRGSPSTRTDRHDPSAGPRNLSASQMRRITRPPEPKAIARAGSAAGTFRSP